MSIPSLRASVCCWRIAGLLQILSFTVTFTGLALLGIPNASGAVTAFLTGGNDLDITGDAAADDILITDNNEGGLRVRGRNGTTVNGVVNGVFDTGMTTPGFIDCDLLGGNDSIKYRGSNQTAGVLLVGGGGKDTISVDRAVISGGLMIVGWFGIDTISINRSIVMGNTMVTGDGGADTLKLKQSVFTGATHLEPGVGVSMGAIATSECVKIVQCDFYDVLDIFLGDGPDVAVVEQSYVGKRLKIMAHDGDDGIRVEQSTVEGITRAVLGPGNDRAISAFTDHVRDTFVLGGDGNDVMAKVGSVFEQDVTVIGGNGADRILTVGAKFGTTGADTLLVTGGAGKDRVYALANIFDAGVILDGGGAFDNVAGDANIVNASYTEINFEGTAAINWFPLVETLLDIDCGM